jgi:hypothetical protein
MIARTWSGSMMVGVGRGRFPGRRRRQAELRGLDLRHERKAEVARSVEPMAGTFCELAVWHQS